MNKIIFDVDGTLTSHSDAGYPDAPPRQEVIDVLRAYRNEDQARARVAALYGGHASLRDMPLDEEEVRALYGGMLKRMEVYGSEQPYYYYQILSMFWKVVRCDALRGNHEKEHGFTYDLVIRLRSDVLICTPFVLAPFFGNPGVVFQSWHHLPAAPNILKPLRQAIYAPHIPIASIMPHFDVGGKFSDIMYWGDSETMARMDGILDFFTFVLNRYQADAGLELFEPHKAPAAYGGTPCSWDMLTNLAIHFLGMRPVLGKTFFSFLVLHLVLEQGVTIRPEEVSGDFRRALLDAFFGNTPFTYGLTARPS
ncbi:MAG: hypothetical protein AB7E47_01900 [Desulfovibrionaceae bacterium]